MEILFEQLIKGILMGWFIVEMPFFAILSMIIIEKFKIKNEVIKFIIDKPFNCLKCGTFWATLIISQNIFLAIMASWIMYIYDSRFNTIDL